MAKSIIIACVGTFHDPKKNVIEMWLTTPSNAILTATNCRMVAAQLLKYAHVIEPTEE
tara:strand:- start:226 stop:399 length:174 start_codon:yes stop_codon:yes gene_type:complete